MSSFLEAYNKIRISEAEECKRPNLDLDEIKPVFFQISDSPEKKEGFNMIENFLAGRPISNLSELLSEKRDKSKDPSFNRKVRKEVVVPTKKKVQPRNRKRIYHATYTRHLYENLKNEQTSVRRKFSVDITNGFGEPLHTFPFDALNTLSEPSPTPKVSDIDFNGKIYAYDRSNEKIRPKTPVSLINTTKTTDSRSNKDKNALNKDFYLKEKAISNCYNDKSANVFVSGSILSAIMASSKSICGWDVIIQKEGNSLFFLQRKDSLIGKEFVNEISDESYEELSKKFIESSIAKERFTLSALDRKREIDLSLHNKSSSFNLSTKDIKSHPKPIHKTSVFPTRSRLFELSPELKVVVKSQIDGFSCAPNSGEPNLVQIRVLNEFNAAGDSRSWRQKLEIQRGGVLVDEVRKNAFRTARWVAQGILSGCEDVQIGFVSRKNSQIPYRHVLQGAIKESLNGLGKQLGLRMENFWAVFREVCERTLEQSNDGKYLLIKDPNNTCLLLFQMPRN